MTKLNWLRGLMGLFPSKKVGGYDAASQGRRLINWQPVGDSANSLLSLQADLMRRRARDLVRSDPWAASGVGDLVANIIGTGISPRSIVTQPGFNQATHELWEEWVKNADFSGVLGFYGMQSLATRGMVEGGEVFIRFIPRRPTEELVVPLQLQMLESEHLPFDENRDLPNGNIIRQGIEFNRSGERVAYHIYKEHPGDSFATSRYAGQTVRIPASEIIHLYKPLRPGQIRGETWLVQAILKLYNLKIFEEAELARKQAAALIAGFITKPSPEYGLAGENNAAADSKGKVDVGWSPGTMQILYPGEDVKFSSPADLGGQYPEFIRIQLRAIAKALGTTYEGISGDYERVSFSSIRASTVDSRRRYEQWQQNIIIQKLCWPVWRRWMDAAVFSGALKAPGYGDNKRAFQSSRWVPQGWEWVDPLKDITATVMMIRNGLKSREQAASELGLNVEEIDVALANEKERANKLGLKLDSDPNERTKNGSPVETQASSQTNTPTEQPMDPKPEGES